MKKFFNLALLAALILGLLLGHQLGKKQQAPESGPASVPEKEAVIFKSEDQAEIVERGRFLSKTLCVRCHDYVPPERYPKRAWAMDVLPVMEVLMGAVRDPYDQLEDAPVLRELDFVPEPALMTPADKNAIAAFYLAMAPDNLPPMPDIPFVRNEKELPGFSMVLTERFERAGTSMLEISEKDQMVYLGRRKPNSLAVYGPDGKRIGAVGLDGAPLRMEERGDRLYFALMPHLLGTDYQEGAIAFISSMRSQTRENGVVAEGLPRVSWIEMRNLDGDPLDEIVFCAPGQWVGRLGILDQKPDGSWAERVLLNRPGVFRTQWIDLNEDGHDDLVALVGQAEEGVLWFDRHPEANFQMRPLLEFLPDFGITHMEWVDLNGDGRKDLMISSGYEGDFSHFPKMARREQGIYIYLNEGALAFRKAGVIAIRGVTQFNARDYDQDGDVDVAAVAYFADHSREDPGFAYFENKGGGNFEGHTVELLKAGHWLVMDSGDLDGDGDLDIVIGSNTMGPGIFPPDLHSAWVDSSPEFLILRND